MWMSMRISVVLLTSLFLLSCAENANEEIKAPVPQAVEDSLETVEADFIYLSDAAVLKGDEFIYGVKMDSTAHNLVEQVAPLKTDEFDMIPVVVKAKIIDNPGPGWNELAQIREIMKIPETPKDTLGAPGQQF